MTSLPPISLAHPLSLIRRCLRRGLRLGIALLIGYFASYLTALSWADLTYVLPATAFGNVIVALLAKYWLHEAISWSGGAGIVLITVGVGFVAHGPALTERPPANAERPDPVRCARGAGAMIDASVAWGFGAGRPRR